MHLESIFTGILVASIGAVSYFVFGTITEVPLPESLVNTGATGALVWFLWYSMTKVFPRITTEFREELQSFRNELQSERSHREAQATRIEDITAGFNDSLREERESRERIVADFKDSTCKFKGME